MNETIHGVVFSARAASLIHTYFFAAEDTIKEDLRCLRAGIADETAMRRHVYGIFNDVYNRPYPGAVDYVDGLLAHLKKEEKQT